MHVARGEEILGGGHGFPDDPSGQRRFDEPGAGVERPGSQVLPIVPPRRRAVVCGEEKGFKRLRVRL